MTQCTAAGWGVGSGGLLVLVLLFVVLILLWKRTSVTVQEVEVEDAMLSQKQVGDAPPSVVEDLVGAGVRKTQTPAKRCYQRL